MKGEIVIKQEKSKAKIEELKNELESSDEDSDKIPLSDYWNRVDPRVENKDSTTTKVSNLVAIST